MKELMKIRKSLEALNRNGVKYVFIGGGAVNAHGVPRYTQDADVLIKNSHENKKRLHAALKEIVPELMDDEEDGFEVCSTVEIGDPPDMIHIMDTVLGLSGDEAFENTIDAEIDGITVKVISYENLLKSKKASGRPQDLADIDQLERVRKYKV